MSLKNKSFYILISLGLYDNKKLLPTLVNTLSKLDKINIIVATSSECQTLRELKEISKKYENTSLILDSENIAELMLRADICIGASGMSIWERCCMGLPSLTITIANNQKKITKETSDLNISQELSIGTIKDKKKLTAVVSNLIYSPKNCKCFQKILQKFVMD